MFYLENTDSADEISIPSYPRTFNIGDLVWGQIRGFPSWPGKLVHESEMKSNHKTEAGKVSNHPVVWKSKIFLLVPGTILGGD